MHDLTAWERPVRLFTAIAIVFSVGLCGCAGVTNPVADGVPVRRLPSGYLPPPKEDEKTIPLTLLRPKPPDAYRLDAAAMRHMAGASSRVLGPSSRPAHR